MTCTKSKSKSITWLPPPPPPLGVFMSPQSFMGLAAGLIAQYQQGFLKEYTSVHVVILAGDDSDSIAQALGILLRRALRLPTFPLPWTHEVGRERSPSVVSIPGQLTVQWSFMPRITASLSLHMEADLCRLFRGQTVTVWDVLRSPIIRSFSRMNDRGGMPVEELLAMVRASCARMPSAVRIDGSKLTFLEPEQDMAKLTPSSFWRDAERSFLTLSLSALLNEPPEKAAMDQWLYTVGGVVPFASKTRWFMQWYVFLRLFYKPGGLLESLPPTSMTREEAQRTMLHFFMCETLGWCLTYAEPDVRDRWITTHRSPIYYSLSLLTQQKLLDIMSNHRDSSGGRNADALFELVTRNRVSTPSPFGRVTIGKSYVRTDAATVFIGPYVDAAAAAPAAATNATPPTPDIIAQAVMDILDSAVVRDRYPEWSGVRKQQLEKLSALLVRKTRSGTVEDTNLFRRFFSFWTFFACLSGDSEFSGYLVPRQRERETHPLTLKSRSCPRPILSADMLPPSSSVSSQTDEVRPRILKAPRVRAPDGWVEVQPR